VTHENFQHAYAAVTNGAGFVALDRWSTVRVSGRERASFLHNMCTNDIKSLSPSCGCEAFFTDVKGKIVAHAFVLAGEDAFSLLMVPDSAGRLIPHLDRYIIREDVTLTDESSDVVWTLVFGANSAEAIGALLSMERRKLDRPWSHIRAARSGGKRPSLHVVRCDLPWCGGYLIGGPVDQVEVVLASVREGGVVQAASAVWHAIRVESAWPLWGVDFDASNLPQEVNRDAATIHFRKGCYLGQETIARIDALGHVNKRLVQVRFSGEDVSESGAELLRDGQVVGRVTSACWSPRRGEPLALAMVKRGADEPNVRLQCCAVEAEVLPPLPSR
jgi:folate-binding protein YgfZ